MFRAASCATPPQFGRVLRSPWAAPAAARLGLLAVNHKSLACPDKKFLVIHRKDGQVPIPSRWNSACLCVRP